MTDFKIQKSNFSNLCSALENCHIKALREEDAYNLRFILDCDSYKLMVRICVDETIKAIRFAAMFPIKIMPEKIKEAERAVALINANIIFGGFYIDRSNNTLFFVFNQFFENSVVSVKALERCFNTTFTTLSIFTFKLISFILGRISFGDIMG